MKSTKKKILDTSRQLFNEQSYSSVTIRMIAKSLKMSSGNLNYHFKKRTEILESIYFEMADVFDERLSGFSEMEISMSQLKVEIELTMKHMIAYQFFWTDLYNILKWSDKIKMHFHEIYDTRHKNYLFLFKGLKKEKLIKASILDWQFEDLAEQMVVFSNTWLYSTALYGGSINESIIEKKATKLLSLLYPYLTTKGKKEFHENTL